MGFFLFTLILSIAWLLFNRQFSNGQAEPTTHPPLLEPTAKWPLSGHLEPGAHQTPSSEGPVSTSTLNHPPGRLLLSHWLTLHSSGIFTLNIRVILDRTSLPRWGLSTPWISGGSVLFAVETGYVAPVTASSRKSWSPFSRVQLSLESSTPWVWRQQPPPLAC